MSGTSHEITALPVVVPLATIAFIGMLWRLHRRSALSGARIALSSRASGGGAIGASSPLLPSARAVASVVASDTGGLGAASVPAAPPS